MESAQLKLSDTYPLASLTPPRATNGNTSPGNPGKLPLDPWLAQSVSGFGNPVPLGGLPGFMSPCAPGGYPSYLAATAAPGNTAALGPGAFPTLSFLSGLVNPSGQGLLACKPGRTTPSPGGQDELGDPRNTSIVSLRMKAKEHMDSIGTIQGIAGQ